MKPGVFSKKIIQALSLFIGICIFSSCENELKISADTSGINFSYSINSGQGFLNILSAATGTEEKESVFDAQEISQILKNAGFKSVDAKNSSPGNLFVTGKLSPESTDPFSRSGMIFLGQKQISIKVNKKNLLKFYDELPEELRAYLDMFMSPVFTGEEMTDAEYMELISEVYGQELADEFSDATIKIAVESPAGNKKYLIKLIDILNIKNELTF